MTPPPRDCWQCWTCFAYNTDPPGKQKACARCGHLTGPDVLPVVAAIDTSDRDEARREQRIFDRLVTRWRR